MLARLNQMKPLDAQWFESRWQQARNRAGKRYTPDLDVSLPIYECFEAVGQDPSFFDRLDTSVSQLRKSTQGFPAASLAAATSQDKVKNVTDLVDRSLQAVLSLSELRKQAPIQLPIAETSTTLQETERGLRSLLQEFRTAKSKEEAPDKSRVEYVVEAVENLRGQLSGIEESITGAFWNAANSKKLLVLGPAGTGKTHLFCEMTQRRINKGLPSLLFLGQSFRAPFKDALQILMQSVEPGADPKELIGAIDEYARGLSARCVIAIDAMNEGDRTSWAQALPDLIGSLRPYEGISLAISCRTPFERILLPQADQMGFQTFFHVGYPPEEQDAAVEKYFRGYGIPLPEVPLLEQEFSNPLFLKLFCEALEKVTVKKKHAQLESITAGQRGMTHILEYFVDEKDRAISENLGTPQGLGWKFLKNVFAPHLATNYTDSMPLAEAVALADGVQPKGLASGTLLQALINEDILAEDVAFSSNDAPIEIVRFTYQKFSDHLIARHLLASQLDKSSPQSIKKSLSDPNRLGRIFKDQQTALEHANLAQAVMIEFPTRIDNKGELFDFLEWDGLPADICEGFVEGLYWREPRSINGSTDRWVLSFADYEPVRGKTLNVLVALAVKPDHPYNFTRLDAFLNRKSLVERDLFWTEYLRKAASSDTPPRILVWAEHLTSRALSEEFATAYIAVLKWFLTSTARGFRDASTHALFRIGRMWPTALFEETIHSLPCNDPYVVERLLAASYGVTMSLWQDGTKRHFKKELLDYARQLFRLMFSEGAKYGTTHILARDYAYHSIDLALKLKPCLLSHRKRKLVRPPFRIGGIRQWKEAEDKDDGKYRQGDAPLGMDFANYTIGGLVPNRSPYDDKVPDYQQVKKQILWRIYDLGYSLEAFSKIDQEIARRGFYEDQKGRESSKAERYGKKYAWIAFYEVAGYRQDLGLLAEREERISDADIDPSFPERPQSKPIFTRSWIEHEGSIRDWLHSKYQPDVEEQLLKPSLEDIDGPWVMIHGHVNRRSKGKNIFAFLDGLLVRKTDTERMITALTRIGYPGNLAIPRPEEEHYTYAGEIPWADTWRSEQEEKSISLSGEKVRIELPVRNYAWESYHSVENRLGGLSFLTKTIAEELKLHVQIPAITMADKKSPAPATFNVEAGEGFGDTESILFLRQDLLDSYLKRHKLDLVMFVWGERRADYLASDGAEDARSAEGMFNVNDVLHKQGFVYKKGSFERFL